jgi:hypothetical protein
MSSHCTCGWVRPSIPTPLEGLTTFTAPYAGAVPRPILTKLGDWIDAADLGFIGDDMTDNAPACAKLNNLNPGDQIRFRPGRYRYTGTMTLNQTLNLVGTSKLHSILVPMTPNQAGIRINASFCQVRSLGLERVIKPVAGGDGISCAEGMSNTILEDVWINKQYRGLVLGCSDTAFATRINVQYSESHGVDAIYGTNGGVQWYLHEVLSVLNLGDGFHCVNSTANSGIGPWLFDCHSFGNAQTGYYFQGTPGHPMSDIWMLRCVSSSEGVCGIHFADVGGNLHMLHMPWVELTGALGGFPQGFDGTLSVASGLGHGIRITGNLPQGVINLVGGLVWGCSWSGLDASVNNLHVRAMTLSDNGTAQDPNLEARAGIVIKAGAVTISDCTFLATSGNISQLKGIVVSGAVTQPEIDSSNHWGGYLPLDKVDMSLATLTAATPSTYPLGFAAYIGRLHIDLLDERAGAITPNKFIRIDQGHFEVLNNAHSAVLLRVRDNGVVEAPATTGALRPPMMTTAQRDALTAENGWIIFNTTTGKFQGMEASTWVNLV